MKTTKRFEKAITKLYNAFHKDKLNAYDCSACAVGNLVGHSNWWFHDVSVLKESFKLLELPERPETNNSGYSFKELINIEALFLSQIVGKEQDKETQFNGLEEVVKYLCELDGIPNIMDYTSLFEHKDNKPVKQLSF